jgi:transposase InsO family protein
MWLVLLQSKDKAAQAIMRFQARVERETRKKLHMFRSDRGGEFNSKDFATHLADLGVQQYLIASYSPQQNGMVERRNQTVVGTARSMLKAMVVLAQYRGEAVSTAADTEGVCRARHPLRLGADGSRTWTFYVSLVVSLMKDTRPHLTKLDDRSKPMVFFGYELGSKAYRLFDPVDGRMHVSRDMMFDEHHSWSWAEEVQTAHATCWDSVQITKKLFLTKSRIAQIYLSSNAVTIN